MGSHLFWLLMLTEDYLDTLYSPNESPSVKHSDDATYLCIEHTHTDCKYYAIEFKCVLNISAEHISLYVVDNCIWNWTAIAEWLRIKLSFWDSAMFLMIFFFYIWVRQSPKTITKTKLSINISTALWRNIMSIFRSSKKILLDLTQEIFFQPGNAEDDSKWKWPQPQKKT